MQKKCYWPPDGSGGKKGLTKILLAMRLTAILLTVAVLQVNASGLAQTVSLSGKSISLKKVFAEIKQQTGYVVFSNTNTISDAQNVSVYAENMPLRDLLNTVLKDLPVTYLIKDKTIVLSRKTAPNFYAIPAPPASVSGVIRSVSGELLPGVSIRVRGTTNGTITNGNGEFKLTNLPENAVLVISILGFETLEVAINGTSNGYVARSLSSSEKGTVNSTTGNAISVSVRLTRNTTEMNDVVINGYTNISKTLTVGAINTFKADSIRIASETSIDQMLQGIVPGMSVLMPSGQVGATPKIRVRGTSTILGDQEPVWVVDGVIQRDPLPIPNGNGNLSGDLSQMRLIASNSISWLNPSDIETITVLKDASATAIYGSQAANGVIVLTTKKARPGSLSVNYGGTFSVGQKPSYGLYDLMNSQELMQFSQEVYNNRDSYTNQILPIGYGALVLKLQNKEIDYDTYVKEYRKMENQNTDWFDLLFRNSFSQQHNISISGGTDKIVNRTSFSMQQQNGEAKGNDLKTFSASSNTTLRFGSRLTVNLMLNAAIREANGFAYGVSPFDYAYNTARTIPMYNDDGTFFYHEKTGETSTAIPNKFTYNYNIQNELNNTGNKNTTTTLSSTVDVRLQLMKGLEYQGLLSYNTASSNVRSHATELSYYITQKRGYEFGSVLSNSPQELASRLPFGGLSQIENAANKGYTFRNSLVYNRNFDLHTMVLQAGIEARSGLTNGSTDTRYGYLRYRGETYAAVPITWTPLGTTGSSLIEEMRANSRIVNTESNYLSEYFSAVYAYDQRYILNANGRLDASNRFGQDRNKRFQPTWSLGAKWRVANEKLFHKMEWLNAFDLSASYGYQGNTVEAVSPYLIATDGGLSTLFKQYTLNIKSLPYPDLGWEKTNTVNLGLDMSFLRNRLNASLNWYNKQSNVLASRPVPVENGMGSATVFGSKMYNSGYELMISITAIQSKNFYWNFSVNTARVRNRVEENARVNLRDDYTNGTAIVNGQPYSTFYSYSFNGLNPANGRPMFNNMNIKPTSNDLEYLVRSGKLDPDFSGGFSNNLRYKNWSMNVLFAVSFGNNKRVPPYYTSSGAPTPERNVPRDLIYRWKKPGDEKNTTIPSIPSGNPNYLYVTLPVLGSIPRITLYDMYNLSDLMVADASFVRCRNISLAYEFKPELLRRLHVKRMSANLSMTNPFFISFDDKWRGYDPETGGWPARRTASAGVNMSF